MNFSNSDYWKGIILYGLNDATYKIALGKTLLTLAKKNKGDVTWNELSEEFLEQYLNRFKNEMKPQQGNPSRRTEMERIIMALSSGSLTRSDAIADVDKAFRNVIPRFHTIGRDKEIAREKFYEFEDKRRIIIKDSLFEIAETDITKLLEELDARWSLLEGAFVINHDQYDLANDIIEIYLKSGYRRQNLTSNVPFLDGYQANICFYCSESMLRDDIHVDHLLPRSILNHDEIWNLVLCHSHCNLKKSNYLVGKHYFEKLIIRNENIMGSNHPWKNKIKDQLGATPEARKKELKKHYDNVHKALGNNYWGGIEGYNPSSDPFYKYLITNLNNKL